MAKDPAVLFYYQDFLVGTEFMNDEEVGKYIRLLCHQADKGRLSKKHMMKICNSQVIPETISEKFIVDENGLFFNKRMELEKEKRSNYVKSRSSNRKGSKDMKDISKTYEEHMEDENENINEDVIKSEDKKNKDSEKKIEFEKFWNLYDKKVDKKNTFKKWKKLTVEEKEKIMEYIPKYKIAKPDKQFRKDPSTFINKESWNDELIYDKNGEYPEINKPNKYQALN